jgi:hypothetical protein
MGLSCRAVYGGLRGCDLPRKMAINPLPEYLDQDGKAILADICISLKAMVATA